MSYKTILVHVDDAKNINARIEIAAKLAIADDAHLIGSATTGMSTFIAETVSVDPTGPDITPYLETLRQTTENRLAEFENIARRMGVVSYESRLADESAANSLGLQARYCDLVILGQRDSESKTSYTQANLPEHVVLSGGCPVLIIPHTGTFKNVGEHTLIAWNASLEATRSVHAAIPLLQRAKIVEVAVFNHETHWEAFGEQPGADIGQYLARHNIKVDVTQEKTNAEIGKTLLGLASSLNSDLLVMGCYGHSRLRELLLGGATRTVLQSMTVPVLMSR